MVCWKEVYYRAGGISFIVMNPDGAYHLCGCVVFEAANLSSYHACGAGHHLRKDNYHQIVSLVMIFFIFLIMLIYFIVLYHVRQTSNSLCIHTQEALHNNIL